MDFYEIALTYEKDFLEDLKTLIEIDSAKDETTAATGQPFGKGPGKALEAFLQLGIRDGFEVKNHEGYAGVIFMPASEENQGSVGALGHVDVVPAGEGWTKDPFDLLERKGILFGRGVLDDKGPLLAAYYAMKMIRDLNIPVRKKLMVIAGTDEESGMECMDYYREHGEIPTVSFSPDALFPVVHAEKGRMLLELSTDYSDSVIREIKAGIRPNVVISRAEAIVNAQKDVRELFEFYLKTNRLKGFMKEEDSGLHIYMEGKEAHAAIPFLGNNAGLHLLNFIGEAYGDRTASDLYSSLWDWKGTPEHLYINGNYMGFLTMNTGLIQTDQNDKVIRAVVDIRYPNEKTSEMILQAFEDSVPSGIKVKQTLNKDPLFVHPDSPLVKTLMESYAAYTGDTLRKPLAIGGGTYAKKLPNCVGFGPKFPGDRYHSDVFVGGAHARDEGIKKDVLFKSMAIYADAFCRLANNEKIQASE